MPDVTQPTSEAPRARNDVPLGKRRLADDQTRSVIMGRIQTAFGHKVGEVEALESAKWVMAGFPFWADETSDTSWLPEPQHVVDWDKPISLEK